MIEYLEIENFKAFSQRQRLKMAPLTLIYGPNSSGKSSIIQSIMMIRQTILSKQRDGVIVTSGDNIHLGDFKSLVYSQDISKNISFSFVYKNNINAKDYYQETSKKILFSNNDHRTLELSINLVNGLSYINQYSFVSEDKSTEKVNFSFSKIYGTSEDNDYHLSNKGVFLNNILKIQNSTFDKEKLDIMFEDLYSSPFKINRKINFPTRTLKENTIIEDYMNRASDDIGFFFENLTYLGPLRSSPKRFYSSDISNYQKGQGKKNLGLELFNTSVNVKENINVLLRDFAIPYEIDAKDIGDSNTGNLIKIELKDLRNNAIITPKDVGFGIGQVLPIILESMIVNNKTISIEQPEIHLHPKLQAQLADLFIDSALKNNNQWIIETHSESLMLRLQRRIKEKKIDKNLISVLYVDVGENGAQVTELPLDDDGDFTIEWPNGFFEERLNEVFGI